MNTRHLIYGLAVAACCWACSNDEVTEPSNLEKDWYVLTYDPNASPLEQEIYSIYEETGVPIFLSDTIGSQTRYNQGGEPYTYYHMFDPGYNFITYNPTYTYSLEYEETDLEAMVDLLGNYALRPYFRNDYGEGFKGKYGPHALVVLDSIWRSGRPDTLLMDQGVIGLSTRFTLKTGSGTTAASYTEAKNLTEEQKKKFGWNFAMYELNRYLSNSHMDDFAAYRIILRSIPQEYSGRGTPTPFQLNRADNDYSVGSGTARQSYNINDYNMDVNEPQKYGVLAFPQNNGYSVYFPNWQEDLSLYMNLIYTKTDEEIRAEYGDFPYVIQRYEALLALIQKAGLTQFIYQAE